MFMADRLLFFFAFFLFFFFIRVGFFFGFGSLLSFDLDDWLLLFCETFDNKKTGCRHDAATRGDLQKKKIADCAELAQPHVAELAPRPDQVQGVVVAVAVVVVVVVVVVVDDDDAVSIFGEHLISYSRSALPHAPRR